MEHDVRDHEDFVEADVAFHLKLAEAARNSVLRDIHSSIQALLRAWITRVIASAGNTIPSYEEHVPIVEAVRAGDLLAARQAMESHMVSATGRLRSTLLGQEGWTSVAAESGYPRGKELSR